MRTNLIAAVVSLAIALLPSAALAEKGGIVSVFMALLLQRMVFTSSTCR